MGPLPEPLRDFELGELPLVRGRLFEEVPEEEELLLAVMVYSLDC